MHYHECVKQRLLIFSEVSIDIDWINVCVRIFTVLSIFHNLTVTHPYITRLPSLLGKLSFGLGCFVLYLSDLVENRLRCAVFVGMMKSLMSVINMFSSVLGVLVHYP